jgi:hypothetical protein
LPAGLAGTIQAQIVGEERQKPQQIEESYRFPAAMPQCLHVTARQAMARKVISRQAYLNRLVQDEGMSLS